jgi:hypothetical protein
VITRIDTSTVNSFRNVSDCRAEVNRGGIFHNNTGVHEPDPG